MSKSNFSSRLVVILSWAVILSPSWVYLTELTSFGSLQNHDYYAIVEELVDDEELTRDPVRWLKLKSNEHRATLPALVYALNMGLAHGHNLPLSVVSLLLLAIVLALLLGLLPADMRSPLWLRTLFGLGMAFFCFNPVAAMNVAMGFAGVPWYSSDALAVAAIAALTRRAGEGTLRALWPALVFGVLGAFCFSTNLALWPALLVGGVYLGLRRRGMILVAAGAALVLGLFALTYQALPHHPEANTKDLLGLLRYSAAFLGSPASGDLTTAEILGWIAIAASLASFGLFAWLCYSSKALRPDLAPWLMLQIYGVGNAFLAAVGRSGFGHGQALSTRYATIAALFWIGLLTPPAILAWRHRPASAAGRAAVAAGVLAPVAAFAAAMQSRGAPLIDELVARASRQEVAALALVHGIPDGEIIDFTVAGPGGPWRLRDFMRANRHVPFDRERPLELGEPVDAGRLNDRPHPGIQGFLDHFIQAPDYDVVRLGGWVFHPEAEVAEVVVLDGGRPIRAAIVTGIHRPDVAERVDPEALASGWEGYAVVGRERESIRAWVRLAGDPTLYPLPAIDAVERILGGSG